MNCSEFYEHNIAPLCEELKSAYGRKSYGFMKHFFRYKPISGGLAFVGYTFLFTLGLELTPIGVLLAPNGAIVNLIICMALGSGTLFAVPAVARVANKRKSGKIGTFKNVFDIVTSLESQKHNFDVFEKQILKTNSSSVKMEKMDVLFNVFDNVGEVVKNNMTVLKYRQTLTNKPKQKESISKLVTVCEKLLELEVLGAELVKQQKQNFYDSLNRDNPTKAMNLENTEKRKNLVRSPDVKYDCSAFVVENHCDVRKL